MKSDAPDWARALENDAFLALVLNHIAHPIFIKDRDYRFVFVNEATCRLFGKAREAILGKSDYDFFSSEEADFFRLKDAEMFESGTAVQIDEETLTNPLGVRHVLATTKVPLRSHTGEISHLVGIIHDITRLKLAEEALREINEELERRVQERSTELAAAQNELVRKERLAVLGQLAGGVAHQIRNPLGAISNAAYVLKRTAATAPDGAHAVDIIHEEVWRANRIISDLLDYARVRPAVAREVAVDDLVDAALNAQLIPANVTVIRALENIPVAYVDPVQVRGAFTNLVQNAIDAMPEGGRLTLSATSTDRELEVVFADSGTGISDQVRARLFEPLVSTKPLGLGLGLTTARTLIENQGGTITFEDATPTGTRFMIRLPRRIPTPFPSSPRNNSQ